MSILKKITLPLAVLTVAIVGMSVTSTEAQASGWYRHYPPRVITCHRPVYVRPVYVPPVYQPAVYPRPIYRPPCIPRYAPAPVYRTIRCHL